MYDKLVDWNDNDSLIAADILSGVSRTKKYLFRCYIGYLVMSWQNNLESKPRPSTWLLNTTSLFLMYCTTRLAMTCYPEAGNSRGKPWLKREDWLAFLSWIFSRWLANKGILVCPNRTAVRWSYGSKIVCNGNSFADKAVVCLILDWPRSFQVFIGIWAP